MDLVYCNGDEILGPIFLPRYVVYIINHKLFQRLKDVKQLSNLYIKYPNAKHTRYDHSIGVAYWAMKLSNSLKEKDKSITKKQCLLIIIAALAHDLGHGPQSHPFDYALREMYSIYAKNLANNNFNLNKFKENIPHERRSQVIIEKIIRDLNESKEYPIISDSEIKVIQFLIEPEPVIPEEISEICKEWMCEIVNNIHNRVDVDKFDYIPRDMVHMSIQVPEILSHDSLLKLVNSATIIGGKIHYSIEHYNIISNLLSQRGILYDNYYNTENSHILSKMIQDAMILMNKDTNFMLCIMLETNEDFDKFAMLTDEYVNAILLSDPQSNMYNLTYNAMIGNPIYRKINCTYENTTEILCNGLSEVFVTQYSAYSDKARTDIAMPKVLFHHSDKPVQSNQVKGFVKHSYFSRTPNKS